MIVSYKGEEYYKDSFFIDYMGNDIYFREL